MGVLELTWKHLSARLRKDGAMDRYVQMAKRAIRTSSKGLVMLVSSCQSIVRQTFKLRSSAWEAMYFPTGSQVSPLTRPEWPFRVARISTGKEEEKKEREGERVCVSGKTGCWKCFGLDKSRRQGLHTVKAEQFLGPLPRNVEIPNVFVLILAKHKIQNLKKK